MVLGLGSWGGAQGFQFVVLGDFDVHAEAVVTGAAQELMATMTTTGLFQNILVPTSTVSLVFSGDKVRSLAMGECLPLSSS